MTKSTDGYIITYLKTYEELKNVAFNQEEEESVATDPEITQISELADTSLSFYFGQTQFSSNSP